MIAHCAADEFRLSILVHLPVLRVTFIATLHYNQDGGLIGPVTFLRMCTKPLKEVPGDRKD